MSAFREILAHFGIEVDTTEIKKGKEEVEDFVETLKGVGEKFMAAFAVHKVEKFVMGMAEAAEKLELQAVTLGIGTKALQEWQFAADMSGIKSDALTGAFMRLEKGGKGGAGGLAALGLSAKDAHGKTKPVTDLMDEVADKIQKIEDPTKRAEAVTKLFGKTGQKMIPFLEQGSKGIKKFRDEVKGLGGGMNEDFIAKSKAMLQETKRLNMAWESFKVNVVGAIIPAVSTLVQWFTKGAVWLRELAESSSTVEAAWIALGIAGVVALSSMLGPLGALLLELAPIIAGFLVLEDIITFLQGGDSEFGDLIDTIFGPGAGEKFRKWINDALADFWNFVDMITGGHSEAAEKWRADWQFFKEQLVKDFGIFGKQAVWFIDLFTNGWDFMVNRLNATMHALTAMFKFLWHSWSSFATAGIDAVIDTFASFVNGFLSGVSLILEGAKMIAQVAGKDDIVAKYQRAIDTIQGGKMTSRGAANAAQAREDIQNDLDEAMAWSKEAMKTKAEVHPDDIAERASAMGGQRSLEQKNEINIHVPAGTGHGLAKEVGEAAEDGVNRANAASLLSEND